MTLSTTTISQIADALKPEIIRYIYSDEKYAEFMQEMIISAIDAKMGKIDDDLLYDLGMLIFDRIELKWWNLKPVSLNCPSESCNF